MPTKLISMKYKKIFVVCGGNVVTGGPELLHQLVHELREFAADAYIAYAPFSRIFQTPSQYKKYNCPQLDIEDEMDNLVIFPEGMTRYSFLIKRAQIGIWWLSVDNYYRFPQNNTFKNIFVIKNNKFYDPIRYAKAIIKNRPIFMMKNFLHYCQSNYARDFLLKKSVNSTLLGDYISDVHHEWNESYEKENVIIYNPKKGFDITERIIKYLNGYRFVAIENMSSEEVIKLMKSSKVYIDFGNHPGKDRPPREAVLHGCCVLMNADGAAGSSDYIIDQRYRFSVVDNESLKSIKNVIDSIFMDFDNHHKNFNSWRIKIREEKRLFKEQVFENFINKSN